MRFTFVISALFAATLCLSAPAQAKTFNAETFTLENGLEVVVIPNHRAPVVTHMIWYKFGGADEAMGQSGIAHFLEHLMFKGTPTVPKGEFSATVKKLGGEDNAFTGHDYTAYFQSIPRAHLEKVMQMEADRMKNLNIDGDEVASERQVVIEERGERVDNEPQAKLNEQIMSALFVNHPYSIPVIGWLHEIEQLTEEDAYDHYNRWYAPNNAILVVAGDVTAAELKPLAHKYYGSIPPQTIPDRNRPAAAPIVGEHRIILQDEKVGQPILMKFYRAPRGSDALELASEILGGTSTARLYRSLVVDQRIAVSAGASYDPVNLDETTFVVYASPAPRVVIADLEAALDREMEKLLSGGITEEELTGAKARKTASLSYYLDSLQGPAMVVGRALASGFSIDHVENEAARIEKLGVGDINKSIQNLLRPANLPVTGILLPERSDAKKKGGAK